MIWTNSCSVGAFVDIRTRCTSCETITSKTGVTGAQVVKVDIGTCGVWIAVIYSIALIDLFTGQAITSCSSLATAILDQLSTIIATQPLVNVAAGLTWKVANATNQSRDIIA